MFVFRLQEKHNREKLRDHLKSMVAIQEELKEVQKRVQEMQGKIKDAHLRQERLLGSSSRYINTYSSIRYIAKKKSEWPLNFVIDETL